MRRALVLLSFATGLLACATPAVAKTPSAAWLMQQLANQAQRNAAVAAGTHRKDEARTWRAWEERYRMLAGLPVAQQIDAITAARGNVAGNRQLARQAQETGAADAADLYQASAVFWDDLATQLAHGDTLSVRFPERQMLHPVPGLPGTPWEHQTGVVSSGRADCPLQAQRMRSCQAQVSALLSRSLATGEDAGDFLVVRRAQCDRAEELYLAHCSGH